MGFNERIKLAENMEKHLIRFLLNNNFILEKTGYENYISKETIEILRKIHDNPTIKFLRYMPDYFTKYQDKFFFIELKVMDSPILLDKRVEDLKKITGLNNLSKQNIGVIETAALQNYEALSKLDVKILFIVYATFNSHKLLIEWENNLAKFYSDNVHIGNGDASFTPYTNINLDKMRDIKTFFKEEFNINLEESDINNLLRDISTKV